MRDSFIDHIEKGTGANGKENVQLTVYGRWPPGRDRL